MLIAINRIYRIAKHQVRNLTLSHFIFLIRHFLFRHETILIYHLNVSQLHQEEEPSYNEGEVRKGCFSQLASSERSIVPLPWEFCCHKYDGVSDFFVAVAGDQIEHISWIYYQGDPNRMIRLGPKDAEIKYSLTLPPFRGKDLYPQTLKSICRYLKEKGFRNVFISVDVDNKASISGIQKAGFACMTKIRLHKIMGFQVSRKYRPPELQI